ncbi:MAG: hypothetical protein EOM18_08700 [Clostridia bacterium]|nr:hypothetical protein [Clostridia bacterium]
MRRMHMGKWIMKKILKDKSVWVLSAGCIALCILFVLSRGVFGSQVDWICQHSTLTDYFRKHFYQTGELFPDFAWNLGGGQNIYNFAYYGIYSPLILGSYLLPFIPMDICIMGGSILSYVVSVVLFYRWLIEKGISWKHSFSTACMFALATPLIFQFHTQLMFVNYMPFLCMALWGCDRYHQVRKRGMLIIGITGMILSSFYFSMGGLIAIFLYALSECRGKKGTLWGIFWNTGLSVALSGVLLVPTAMAILQGRGGQETGRAAIGILSLPPTRLLYSSYGIGLTAFSLVCLLGCILCAKKWQERILPIGLLIIFSVPVFALVLNGGLYLRDKVFIPFLPLVCLVMAKYLEEKVRRKRDILPYLAVILLLWFSQSNKNFGSYWIWAVADAVLMLLLYLVWQKFPKIPWQILASCVILFFCGWIQNWQEDKILSREEYESITDETKTQAISDILEEDPSLYRLDMVGDGAENKANINRIFDARQRITSVYSSVSNNDYNEFRKNIFRLNEPLRNNMMQ